MNDNTQADCPYCHIALTAQGFMEQQDDLGTYIAETFLCESCGYRLERNPVYIDGDDDNPSARRIVES